MLDYRTYELSTATHITGPAHVVTCDTDHAAIQTARDLVAGHDFEVWDGPRLVVRIKSPPADAHC